MRPAFRPAAGGARAAGNRDQGARSCFRTQDRPSIRAHKPRAHKQGTSARGRSAVHHVRADASAPLEPPARRRTVGLGATAQAPIDLNRCDPRAQTSNAGSDPGRRRELPSRGRMSPTAPARWPTEKHEMSLEDPYHARNDARDRCPSHPPRSDPGHPWASLADGGRLAPWLEGGGGQRSDLPRSIGSVPLEIPFPNVSRPA